jgi:hypothetical protein
MAVDPLQKHIFRGALKLAHGVSSDSFVSSLQKCISAFQAESGLYQL